MIGITVVKLFYLFFPPPTIAWLEREREACFTIYGWSEKRAGNHVVSSMIPTRLCREYLRSKISAGGGILDKGE